ELADAVGRVPEHFVLRKARHDLVVAHHVDERHGVRRRLDAGDVEHLEPVDVGQDRVELRAHRLELGVAELEPREPRDVEHVLSGDPWHQSSSRFAYWSESCFLPTEAKRTVTSVSPPLRSTPTTSPSPQRPWRTRAPTLRGRSARASATRSEEHTSELQSRVDHVCQLLLVKQDKH